LTSPLNKQYCMIGGGGNYYYAPNIGPVLPADSPLVELLQQAFGNALVLGESANPDAAKGFGWQGSC